MSKERFFVPNKHGRHGLTPKGPWYDLEIAKVMSENRRTAEAQYWIHVHVDDHVYEDIHSRAIEAAQTYLDKEGLRDVFQIGASSILSTDRDDKNSPGCFFRLDVIDAEKADEFCMDTYDPDADRAFFDWIFQASPSSRGPRPI